LATAYGIVRSHGGLITCYSELGIGTTFRVYLPVLEGAEAARAVVAGATTPELPTGRETILVVDDEEAIVELGRRSLEGLGYRVLAAGSGEEALEVFRRHRGEVDLVLLDLGMPGMGGPRCLKALKDLDPQVRVIIASGYSANGAVREFLRDGAVGYLGKPFRLKDLAQKVREVLDA
jgi:CheY-like chemotaxis protein